jgi:hypothetical protein
MSTVEDCSVDKDAIAAHYNANLGWNMVPFLGPILGQTVSPSLPKDYQSELDTQNGDLDAEISLWRDAIDKLSISNTENLDTLVTSLPNYVNATAELVDLPTSIKTNVIYIQVITLSIIMALVIFLGL